MHRALLLLVVFASSAAVAPSQVSQPDFRLQVVPAIVYKVDDPGGARTSSLVFSTAVICSKDCELTPISARVELIRSPNAETWPWSRPHVVSRRPSTWIRLSGVSRTHNRLHRRDLRRFCWRWLAALDDFRNCSHGPPALEKL
jgi:hypothetical protein